MPIGFQVDSAIATITIEGYNDLNPLMADTVEELLGRLKEIDRSTDVKVAILRGAGERHFSAGVNLKQKGTRAPVPIEDQVSSSLLELDGGGTLGGYAAFWATPTKTPVIAALRGYCLGGGLMIVGRHTSLRIAGTSTQMGFPELKFDQGGTAAMWSQLSRQIPHSVLTRMVTTACNIDAATALRIGFVNEVVPDAQVMARAREVAELIAAQPALPLRADREVLHHSFRAAPRQAAALAFAANTWTAAAFTGAPKPQ